MGCRNKANCPHAGPGPIRGMFSMGIFLMDPSSYLRKVDKRDQGLNLAPPLYQFRAQNHSATVGAYKGGYITEGIL